LEQGWERWFDRSVYRRFEDRAPSSFDGPEIGRIAGSSRARSRSAVDSSADRRNNFRSSIAAPPNNPLNNEGKP